MARATTFLLILVGGLMAAQAPAHAQSDPAPDAAGAQRDGRYSMTPAPEGFLRLDTRTGAVSHCRLVGGGVECREGADERAALQAEIDRLASENAELRKKLAGRGEASPGARLREALPTDKDFERALGWMEQFLRRMMNIVREEQPADRI